LERLLYRRKDHPLSEAENVIFNSNNEVVKIGKIALKKKKFMESLLV
jgi:hypothetical protein